MVISGVSRSLIQTDREAGPVQFHGSVKKAYLDRSPRFT